ncbi:unknown [Bacteroides ovatus CAG:22]|nr:unknown [Bacteroides ovatus CAG:22]
MSLLSSCTRLPSFSPSYDLLVHPGKILMEFMARSEADCSNAWISPLPAPSRTISIKIPHATANPVRKVLSLLRLMVLYISCQMSIMIMFV